MSDLVGTILAKLYKVKRKIGHGSFGEVYLGVNIKTNQKVAIKLERINNKYPQLMQESRILKHFDKKTGFPIVHYCGQEHDYKYIVMDLLGPNLEELFIECNRKFTLKTILLTMTQLLERIEIMHEKGFIHRDIKPENFCMGLHEEVLDVTHVVDFGLSKRYIDPRTTLHIPFRDDKHLTGTLRFASIHSHMGEELSRRDDLESLSYLLLYLYYGELPWQNLNEIDGQKVNMIPADYYRNILLIKKSKAADLCKGCPQEFAKFLDYCRNLSFTETPNYEYLKGLLRKVVDRFSIDLSGSFDWDNKTFKMNEQLEQANQDKDLRDKSQVKQLTSCLQNTNKVKLSQKGFGSSNESIVRDALDSAFNRLKSKDSVRFDQDNVDNDNQNFKKQQSIRRKSKKAPPQTKTQSDAKLIFLGDVQGLSNNLAGNKNKRENSAQLGRRQSLKRQFSQKQVQNLFVRQKSRKSFHSKKRDIQQSKELSKQRDLQNDLDLSNLRVLVVDPGSDQKNSTSNKQFNSSFKITPIKVDDQKKDGDQDKMIHNDSFEQESDSEFSTMELTTSIKAVCEFSIHDNLLLNDKGKLNA